MLRSLAPDQFIMQQTSGEKTRQDGAFAHCDFRENQYFQCCFILDSSPQTTGY